MTTLLLAVAFAVVLWWLGTGIVLGLQQRLRADGPAVNAAGLAGAAGATEAAGTEGAPAVEGDEAPAPRIALGVAGGALAGGVALIAAAHHTGVAASLAGFTAALVLWGALELSHYLGFITGTHARLCPQEVRGWSRFRLALGTSIHHELSVLACGLLFLGLLHDAPNTAGLHAFLVLWLMRWSAKLNLFFGVPNFSTDWFPTRLSHLASYIRHAPVTPFYPIALTAAALAAITLGRLALEAPGSRSLMYALPAVLLALAVLEHLFMALPIADSRLWNRVFGVRRAPAVERASGPTSSASADA